MGREGTYGNTTKAIYDKPTANITFSGEELKHFLWDHGQGKDVHSRHFLNTDVEVLATAIREEKEIKGIQIGKEEVKLSLFADDMISHTENPKNATRKLLELINELGKLADYKINAKKSVAFLYIQNYFLKAFLKKGV